MITIEVAKALRADLKRLVDEFLSDKYPLADERELITDDLAKFAAQQYAKSISFCVYERGTDHIGQGYTLNFDYSGGTSAFRTREFRASTITSISDSVEKILFVELSEQFFALSRQDQVEFLAGMGPWEFFGSLAINVQNPMEHFSADGIKVTIGEICAQYNR